MSFSKFALGAAEKLRPVLVKIVPQKLLSSVKAKMITRSAASFDKSSLAPFDPLARPAGVNLIGNLRADTGLGQSMRLVSHILDESGYENDARIFFMPPGGSMNNHSCDEKITDEDKYGVNLIHVNPSEFPMPFINMGAENFSGHYNIGYWLWELKEFPEDWLPALELADEIWTPSEFISDTIRNNTDKPVLTVPYPVEAPFDEKYTREHFGLPEDKFLFLMMFDSGSVMARKNPLAVIEAFKKAFAPEETGVGLVLKIHEARDEDVALIREQMKGYDNIYLVSGTLPKIEVNSLIKTCDVFVSLHRAEGFGLVCAEAMLLGTPCIATNWSANTEFMSDSVACMVDYKLVEIEETLEAFKKGYHWAEADTSVAARYMKMLFEDKEFYGRIRVAAKSYIQTKLSISASAAVVKKRLDAIYGK